MYSEKPPEYGQRNCPKHVESHSKNKFEKLVHLVGFIVANACYYSVQNLLFSSLLSKTLKIKIYKTVIVPVVLDGCENWSLTLRNAGWCMRKG